MAGDYPHGHLVHRLGLAEQEWPEWYHRREGEGNEAYRDRLSHEGYITNVLAPLTGLKCRYIEVVNPLLSRRILTVVRSFPDELRMYGRAFSAIVDPETRPIPHARFSSTPAASVFLGHEEIVEAIIRELTSPEFTEVMSEEAATTLLAAVASPTHTPPSVRDRVTGVLRKARVAMPSTLAYRYTPRFEGPLPLPPIRMAFRSTVASRTIALLRDDARLLAGDAG